MSCVDALSLHAMQYLRHYYKRVYENSFSPKDERFTESSARACQIVRDRKM
jgi:hypothetical protein